MADALPRKAPSKVPPKALVTSKLPARLPSKVVPAAAPKAGVSFKTPVAAFSVSSKARETRLKGSVAPPTVLVTKKTPPPPHSSKGAGKLPPQVESPAAKKVQHFPNTPEVPEELLVIPEPSEMASDESVHLTTYDDVLSPIETPREIPAVHDDGKRARWKELDPVLLQEEEEEEEDCFSEAKELEEEEPVSLFPVTTGASHHAPNGQEERNEENGEQHDKKVREEGAVMRMNCTRYSEENKGDLARQLVMAEERVGQLSWEVARLREALCDAETPLFIQHAFQLERDVERLRREIERERASTKYHREAHIAALTELGKLREEMDKYGTHSSLLKRNTELDAQVRDMAKEKVEQELLILKLQEETAALGTLHGSSGSGSGYVTVRSAGLCGACNEKLKEEADRRAVRNRVAQLVERKSMGAIPPSLSEVWSAKLTRQLQQPREEITSLLGVHALGGSDEKNDMQLQKVVCKSHDEPTRASDAKTPVAHAPLVGPGGLNRTSSMWRTLCSPDGRIIYYNIVTNTSTFECPGALGG